MSVAPDLYQSRRDVHGALLSVVTAVDGIAESVCLLWRYTALDYELQQQKRDDAMAIVGGLSNSDMLPSVSTP